MLQFGLSIAQWNTVTDAYAEIFQWDKDEKTTKQTAVQSITTAGSAIGALFSGPVMKIGRWKCIMLTNILVLSGSVLSVFQNMFCLYAGRFLFGMAAGAFTVFCPKYISEVAPIEVKGPAGALSQIFCTFGILVPFSIALAYPNATDPE